eukprot:5834679-Amphidinium_carterae.1
MGGSGVLGGDARRQGSILCGRGKDVQPGKERSKPSGADTTVQQKPESRASNSAHADGNGADITGQLAHSHPKVEWVRLGVIWE